MQTMQGRTGAWLEVVSHLSLIPKGAFAVSFTAIQCKFGRRNAPGDYDWYNRLGPNGEIARHFAVSADKICHVMNVLDLGRRFSALIP